MLDKGWTSIGDMIEWSAQSYGGKEFLRSGGCSVSFSEADEITRHYAERLAELGLRPGDRVGLLMPNGIGWPLMWLALCRSGLITVPVNRNYTPAEIRYVLNDAGAAAVITTEDLQANALEALHECRHARMLVRASEDASGSLRAVCERDSVTSEDELDVSERIANFQYTSGTTGFPKACVLTHDYWTEMGVLASEVAELRPEDVVLTSQPFSYIDPQWQTIMCLVSGAALVIERKFSARSFWRSVRENGVTFLYVVGTMPMILYKQHPSRDEVEHSLRLVLCSAIPPHMHAAFEERWKVPWREVFGMTETGIDLYVPASAQDMVGSGAAGRAVRTKDVSVLDDRGNELPDGEVGELAVRGKPMMLRYHNRPDDTKSAFHQDWFRTGDLVRKDPRGWVYVLGRLKDMVRRSGENVSAAEVESVINKHNDVKLCAVIGVPHEVRGEELKVFVELREESCANADTARAILGLARSELAPFKVPRYVQFISSMPMTVSERVAKGQLRSLPPRPYYDREYDRWIEETSIKESK